MTDELLPKPLADAELVAALRASTPARVFVGRTGPAYSTATQLELRRDHAAARDAVRAELRLDDFPADFVATWKLFEVETQATSKHEFLMRPDLGRRLSAAATSAIASGCPPNADLQIVIGDGLSASAVIAQVPPLLLLLVAEAGRRGWRVGRPFVVRYCRVGVLNDIGELLSPEVVVLLIGERPGLGCADSLSAYLAYRPRSGDTDAQRNLISNIHSRGLSHASAAAQIASRIEVMRAQRASGVGATASFPLPPGEGKSEESSE